MTDDIMTRVREWLASCVRVATENGVPEEADLEAAALAFIDGEPARLAAAREEQREACIRLIEAFRTGEKYIQLTPEQRRLGLVGSINAQPSAATPLADEIAALRARVAYLEGELHETIGENADLVVRAEKAEDYAKKLQDERARLHVVVNEAVAERDMFRDATNALQAERDDYRAQVEAARAECMRIQHEVPLDPAWNAATDVLRSMDEAKP